MRTKYKLRNRRSGVAIVEFTLSLVVLIPLLLGTFVFGFRLIRSLEMEQIVRDLGHMYARGVDFRGAGGQQSAQSLAGSYDLSSTGTSVVILSAIRVATQADCDANNPVGTHCANLNNPIFTEQLMIGNTSLRINGTVAARSAFGTPPVDGNHYVTSANQANNATAAAGSTSARSGFASVMLLNAGEVAYLVEMVNATPDLNVPGLSGSPQVYARSVF